MKSKFHSWNTCYYCFDVQPFKHQIPIYFCKLSLWHLQHIPWNWFSIPDYVHDHSQAWAGLFGLLTTSSRIKIIYGTTAQFSSRLGNQASTFPKYWQPIPQKCSYVYLTSLEYFSVSLSGQGQQIIPDVVMSWDFMIASNSDVSACQHWWSSYWLCSSSISGLPSSFWAR